MQAIRFESRSVPGRRAALLGLAVACAALLAGCDDRPTFKGIDIRGADYAQTLNLPDQDGRQRTLAEFKGRVVVLFFGYTQCPDVCPTSLGELAQARQLLGADGARLQGLFVSVDPERDRPEIMKSYLANFDAGFLALLPSAAELPALAKSFKVYYKKIDGRTPTSYTMDHSAGSYVYDTEGRLRVYHRYGSGAEALAHDIQRLLAEAR